MAGMTGNQAGELAALRTLTHRLGVADSCSLPDIAANSASVFGQCRRLLAEPRSNRTKDGEAGLIIHRLITQINTFLQRRSVEERWAAAVLIKAYVEAGSWEILSKSAHQWVTALTNNMRKPGPAAVKNTIIMTITRIYTLTWDQPSLVREVTTPTLPGFIVACENAMTTASAAASTVQAVLASFTHLAPRHPTIFRTRLATLTAITSPRLRESPACQNVSDLYSRLSVILHQCKPKDSAATSWANELSLSIEKIHLYLDQIFEGVYEYSRSELRPQSYPDKNGRDAGLQTESVYSSAAIIQTFLTVCQSFFSTPSNMPVNVGLGTMLDVLSRICAIAGCLADPGHRTLQFKPIAAREEQDAILDVLPGLHQSALKFYDHLITTHGLAILCSTQSLLDQVIWVLRAEHAIPKIRASSYDVASAILEVSGPSMSKETVATLLPLLKLACSDMTASQLPAETEAEATTNGNIQVNADSISRKGSVAKSQYGTRSLVFRSASTLLPVVLSRLSGKHLSPSIRTQLDRAAIWSKNKAALLASVLNPPAVVPGRRAASSVLPFLAREFTHDPEVEALIRPRMPLIQVKGRAGDQSEEAEEEEEEEEDSKSEAYGIGQGPLEIDSSHPKDTVAPNHVDHSQETLKGLDTQSRKRTGDERQIDVKRHRSDDQPHESSPTHVHRTTSSYSDIHKKVAESQPHVASGAPLLPEPRQRELVGPVTHEPATGAGESSEAPDAPPPATADDDDDFVMPDLDLREDSDDDE